MSNAFHVQRGWRDHALFRGEYSRGEAWLWLIETACWKAKEYDIRGTSITLERGQLCATRDQLAKAWQWSASAVERFLTRLQTEQMIGRESGQGKTVITICNYTKYQQLSAKTGQQTGQQTGQKSDRNRTAKETGKQENMLEEDANASSRRAILPKMINELPYEIPVEAWNAYIAMRIKIGKRPTEHAIELAVAKLIELKGDGHDPGAVLDQSIFNNYTGLFALKDQRNSTANRNSTAASGAKNRDGFMSALREVASAGIDGP
jgi:hypothetical protein